MILKAALLKFAPIVLLAGSIVLSPLYVDKAFSQEADKAAVEKIVRDYLLANPELLIEVQQALTVKQEALKASQQAETLASKNDIIYNSPNNVIIGDKDAKITVVEFFDYNCGFCKRAMNDMNKIVAENPDVKFVMKEFPVLGEASVDAHRVSYALIHNYPELYQKFHLELMSGEGRKDGQRALEVATKLGADPEKLTAASKDPKVEEAFREVYDLADGLGITGTPSYVIGNEVIFGAVGFNALMPKIVNLKSCGKTIC